MSDLFTGFRYIYFFRFFCLFFYPEDFEQFVKYSWIGMDVSGVGCPYFPEPGIAAVSEPQIFLLFLFWIILVWRHFDFLNHRTASKIDFQFGRTRLESQAHATNGFA